ncbi:hypothetical protein [Halorubellus salinus]|uniref:hypothetical protein n=1 Tax=Halorubellus salinus TaxID=755309 RepID=UPI001D0958FD|nr:hypothetical protein [Halorubellus salinus]
MPREAVIETWTGEKVNVKMARGREYDHRVEISHEELSLLYGVNETSMGATADFLAKYRFGELEALSGDADRHPDWADAALQELDIGVVRA